MTFDIHRLRRELTLSPKKHADYLIDAREYLSMFRLAERYGGTDSVVAASLRQSAVFGVQYLVVVVADEMMDRRDVQAFASNGNSVLPAAVYLPRSRHGDRTMETRALVDHETTHVNQFLLGRGFRDAEDPLLCYRRRLRLEFEAYVLEYHRWPEVAARWLDLDPLRAALAQSHVCALEREVVVAAKRPEEDVARLLTNVRSVAHDELGSMGVERELIEWMLKPMNSFVAKALADVSPGATPTHPPRRGACGARHGRSAGSSSESSGPATRRRR